jgi:hypothetical protein
MLKKHLFNRHKTLNKKVWVGCQWLTPVILATQEVEIRRITVQSQPGQIVHKTLPPKKTKTKRAGGVAQREDPEFKSKSRKKTVINNLKRKKKQYALKSFCFLFLNDSEGWHN